MKSLMTGILAATIWTFGPSDAGFHEEMPATAASTEWEAATDVDALLMSARGAPVLLCRFAAKAVQGMGWGDGGEPPVTRLPRPDAVRTEVWSTQTRDRVIAALGDADHCVGELAVRLLATQPDSLIASPVVERLSARDSVVRLSALAVLGRGNVREAASAIRRALRDDVAGVRANAAWAIGRLRDGASLGALHDLARDRNTEVRLATATALGQIDSTRSIATLTPLLANDPSADVRRVAAWAIGNIDAHEGSAALTRALRDRDARVREMAAWALGQQRRLAEEAGEALMTTVARDDEADVRESAAWALGTTRHRPALQVLASAAADDGSADVRAVAAWGVGNIGGTTAPASLSRALRDRDAGVRRTAAWALKEFDDPASLPAVMDALERETTDRVRQALVRAAAALGGGSDRAVRALVSSSDPKVRELAVRSLVRGRGMDPWPWPMPRPRPFP